MSVPAEIREGDWAGWRSWPMDRFEIHAGPFYYRREPDGRVLCRFIVEPRHLNGGHKVHGGCLLTFADFCVFAIGDEAIAGRAMTVNLSGDFLWPADLGDVMEGTGEVTRAGGRLIYVRGLITACRGLLQDVALRTRVHMTTYRGVSDAEKLAAYAKLAGPASAAGGGRFVVRGDPAKTYESGLALRVVVIEFESVAAAMETHDSPAYQAALQALSDGADRDIRLVEGA